MDTPTMVAGKTYYQVLSLRPSAPQAEITRAYRRNLHGLYPDTRNGAARCR